MVSMLTLIVGYILVRSNQRL